MELDENEGQDEREVVRKGRQQSGPSPAVEISNEGYIKGSDNHNRHEYECNEESGMRTGTYQRLK